VKPGVQFRDLSNNASTYILQGLIEAKFITCSLEEATKLKLDSLFMPHGLGHLLGLDVHDVTVYPKTALLPGMIITIEPGVYFNNCLIDKYLNDAEKK